MTHSLYYHLASNADACSFDESAYGTERPAWACAECGMPRADQGAIDVVIQEHAPPGQLVNFVFGLGVLLIHDRLRELVGDQGELRLGSVVGGKGLVKSWYTARPRNRVIMRGSKHANYRVCETCGQVHYFALGKRYVCPPFPRADVLEAAFGGVLLAPPLFWRLSKADLKGVIVEDVQLLADPIDGLPLHL